MEQRKNAVVYITSVASENEQGETKVVYTSNAEPILQTDEKSKINEVTDNDTKAKLVLLIFLLKYIQSLLTSLGLKAIVQIFLK